MRRDTSKKEKVPLDDLLEHVKSTLDIMQQDLLKKAKKAFEDSIYKCKSLDQIKEGVEKGIAKIAWCGSENCGRVIEEAGDADILGESINEEIEGYCISCGVSTKKITYVARTY